VYLLTYFICRHHINTYSALGRCPLPQLPSFPSTSSAQWSPGPAAPEPAEDDEGTL